MRSAREETSTRDAIVETAVRLFGEHGIEVTSLREVAKAAAVSPALVVHHFGGKAGLVAAADEAALREFGDAYLAGEAQAGDLLRTRASQTAAAMARRPEVCAYIGRALVEGTPGADGLFRAMVAGGRKEVGRLAAAGALRQDADLLWVTLQHFFLIWAPLAFMPLLAEALGGPLLEQGNLERWVEANTALLGEGVYR